MNDNDDNKDNDDTTPARERPLGSWLRAVDGLLTREFATALEAEGVSRRDWMLLNVLSGDIDAPEFRERLTRKGKRLRGLEERGWAEEQGDGTWTLTDLGNAEKERIGVIVDGIRGRVVAAVGGDDAYRALVVSLEAIARELGGDETTAGRDRSFGRFGRPGFGPGFGGGFGQGFGGGFRPGFGGRPGPFDPDLAGDLGRNRHRGFAPGRPGHPAERFDEPMRGEGDDGCRAPHHGSHHHREDHGHGDGGQHHGQHGHGEGHGDHRYRGGHGHHHGHHGEAQHRGGRRTQRAFERGFDAGFARGREAGAA